MKLEFVYHPTHPPVGSRHVSLTCCPPSLLPRVQFVPCMPRAPAPHISFQPSNSIARISNSGRYINKNLQRCIGILGQRWAFTAAMGFLGSWAPNGPVPPALGREGSGLRRPAVRCLWAHSGGSRVVVSFGGRSPSRRASPSTTASRSIPTGITIPLRSLWQPPPYSYSYPMAERGSVLFIAGFISRAGDPDLNSEAPTTGDENYYVF